MREHGIIDPAANDAQNCRGLQCVGIFIPLERNDVG